jgi:hypothetical protein
MKREMTLWDWVFTDIVILLASYFAIDLLMDLKRTVLFTFIPTVCNISIFLLLVVAIYFTQQLIRHGYRLAHQHYEETVFRAEIKNAPVGLGLSQNQIGSDEFGEENGV